jgi:hypothetical protein
MDDNAQVIHASIFIYRFYLPFLVNTKTLFFFPSPAKSAALQAQKLFSSFPSHPAKSVALQAYEKYYLLSPQPNPPPSKRCGLGS